MDCDVCNDIVICSESGDKVVENQERWRYSLDRRERKKKNIRLDQDLILFSLIPFRLIILAVQEK